jgi:hypothetical protein
MNCNHEKGNPGEVLVIQTKRHRADIRSSIILPIHSGIRVTADESAFKKHSLIREVETDRLQSETVIGSSTTRDHANESSGASTCESNAPRQDMGVFIGTTGEKSSLGTAAME